MSNACILLRRQCMGTALSPRLKFTLETFRAELRPSRQWQIGRKFNAFARQQAPAHPRSRKGSKALQKPGKSAKTTPPAQSLPPSPPFVASTVRASARDVHNIFGQGFSVKVAAQIFSELQQRRVTGSLVDTGVDVTHIAPEVGAAQATQALEWLRQHYPVDEAAAAEEYALAEDDKLRAELEAKALRSVLYEERKAEPVRPVQPAGPAQLSIETWSPEKREKWREQLRQAEELEAQYASEQAEVRIAVVQHQIELAERRDDKLAKWDELEKQAELDTDTLTDEKRSVFSRLGAPLAFGLAGVAVLSLCLNGDNVIGPVDGIAKSAWTKPDSMTLTPAIKTCGAITAINLVLLIAWRNPRLWYSMNRLFLLSAGNPNTFSVLGSVFSHQRWIMHLAANTTLLVSLGIPLHDEVGRLNFLVIYLASGMFASCSSLAVHVLTRNFLMASLGASGAIMGLFGAFFTVQPQREMYIPILDQQFSFESWYAIAGFVLLEAVMMWRTKGLKYDHVNHLAGLAAGMAYGRYLRPAQEQERISEIVEYEAKVE